MTNEYKKFLSEFTKKINDFLNDSYDYDDGYYDCLEAEEDFMQYAEDWGCDIDENDLKNDADLKKALIELKNEALCYVDAPLFRSGKYDTHDRCVGFSTENYNQFYIFHQIPVLKLLLTEQEHDAMREAADRAIYLESCDSAVKAQMKYLARDVDCFVPGFDFGLDQYRSIDDLKQRFDECL